MPESQLVTVTLGTDEEGKTTLTIEPSHFVLKDEKTWVQWQFKNLSGNQFGFISFATPLPRLGPFYSLRSFIDPDSPPSVLGKGNKGLAAAGDYRYRALVLDPDIATAVASAEATFRNDATEENTAPEIRVTYVPPPPNSDSPGTVEVTPDPVGLNRGDTATWYFEGLPPNAFACFEFTPGANTPDMNTGLGPFLAFNACKGDGDVTVEASAMGFAVNYPDPKKYPSFIYHIELRDWEGNLLASHEPVIDNLGPPPVGPSTV